MKKLITIIMFLAISAFLFTGCNSQAHLTTNHNLNQTNVVLQSNNYKIIGQVEGRAKGANKKKLLYENAYADMIKNANLQGSQAIIYVNTERITTLVSKRQVVVVNGTVIEFTK